MVRADRKGKRDGRAQSAPPCCCPREQDQGRGAESTAQKDGPADEVEIPDDQPRKDDGCHPDVMQNRNASAEQRP